jgi:hypothetical protein
MRVKILDLTRQGRVKVVWEGDATDLWVQDKVDILSGFDESNSQQLPLLKSYQGPVWDDDEEKFLYFSGKYSKSISKPSGLDIQAKKRMIMLYAKERKLRAPPVDAIDPNWPYWPLLLALLDETSEKKRNSSLNAALREARDKLIFLGTEWQRRVKNQSIESAISAVSNLMAISEDRAIEIYKLERKKILGDALLKALNADRGDGKEVIKSFAHLLGIYRADLFE